MQWKIENEDYIENNRIHAKQVFVAYGAGDRKYIIRLFDNSKGLFRLYIDSSSADFSAHGTLLQCILHAELNLEPTCIASYFHAVIGDSLPADGLNAACGRISVESELGRQLIRIIDAHHAAYAIGVYPKEAYNSVVHHIRQALAKHRSNELR